MIEITQCHVPRGGNVIGFAVTEVGYGSGEQQAAGRPKANCPEDE